MQAQDDALLVERRPRRLAGRARHNPDDRLFGGREMVSIADVPTLDWPIAMYANLAGDVQPKLAKGGRCAQSGFGKVRSRGGPRFVEMAMMAERQRPNGGDVLGALLGSACCTMDRGCEMLRPLWAEEAMHRAYNFLRLVGARKTAIVGEDVFARDLALSSGNWKSRRIARSCRAPTSFRVSLPTSAHYFVVPQISFPKLRSMTCHCRPIGGARLSWRRAN